MLPNEIELFLRSEIAANRVMGRLMDRLFNDEEPDEAREALKRIANQFPDELPQSLDALIYYRGMREALNEDSFRWGTLVDMPVAERRILRRERLSQYYRHLDLFELEIKLARSLQRLAMALRSNWNALEEDVRDGIILSRQRISLRLAAFLYQFNFPGAMDLCDAAVFEMFSLVYLRPPSPAA